MTGRSGAGAAPSLGVNFDVYWLSPGEMEHQALDAGFATAFWGRAPRRRAGKVPRRDICSLAGPEAHPIRAGEDPQLRKLVRRLPVRQERQKSERPTEWAGCKSGRASIGVHAMTSWRPAGKPRAASI